MTDNQAIKYLLFLIKPYGKSIGLIITCLITISLINLSLPMINRDLIDKGFISNDLYIIVKLVAIFLVLNVVLFILDIVKEQCRTSISAKLNYSLSHNAYNHIVRLQISCFDKMNRTELYNNVNFDISKIASITDGSLIYIITQIFNVTGGMIGLILIDYRLTLLVLVFVPAKMVVMKIFAKKKNKITNEYIDRFRKYAKWFGDTIGGNKEIKLFNIYDNKENEFKAMQQEVVDKNKSLQMLDQWNTAIDSLLIQFLTAVIYLVSAKFVLNLSLSIGSLFAFITYSLYVTAPISYILSIGYTLSGIIPSTKRFNELMNLEEEKSSSKLSPNNGDIEFKNLSFSYDGKNEIIKDMSFTISLGSKIAIVGQNGSGKSTAISLLLRLCEPTNGEICMNGIDISKYDLEKYRDLFSVVGQQVYLFDDTIQNNVCLYKEIKNCEEILFECGLATLIHDKTLDYRVGDNGIMLSGGQRQKIALARAIAHNKPIVIFDEATSNTDNISEQHINQMLNTRFKDKTVIMITHKTDLLTEMDNILFCSDGKIVDSGSYEHLLGNVDFLNLTKKGD